MTTNKQILILFIMIYGIGTDVIEVSRIKRSISLIELFAKKIYTQKEIDYCESRGKSKFQSYAGRFAAKEAFFKALGTGMRNGMGFNEIEILNDELGKPDIKLLGEVAYVFKQKKLKYIHVSITHIGKYAFANVVVEK